MPFIPDASSNSGGFRPDVPVETAPQWSDLPGNILPSAGKFVGGIGSALANIVNPDMNKNTLANVGKVGLGIGNNILRAQLPSRAAQTIVPSNAGDEALNALGTGLKARYGGMSNIKNTAITDPVGTLMDLLSIVLPAKEAISGMARAGEEIPAIGKVGELTTQAKGFKSAQSGLARNIIQPEAAGNAIGKLSKEENIAQNVLDVTKGASKYGIEKDIERIYSKVNSKLSDVVGKAKDSLAPVPVEDVANPATGEVASAGLKTQLRNKLLQNPLLSQAPDVINRVVDHVVNLLNPSVAKEGQDISSIYTNVADMHDAGVVLGDQLKKFYKRTGPTDPFLSGLADAKDLLYQEIGKAVPDSRELINAQANLIPASRGLMSNLQPPKGSIGIVRGPFSMAGRAVSSAVDPVQAIIARNPNSEFAQRLRQLVPEVGPATGDPRIEALLKSVGLNKVSGLNLQESARPK